MSGMGGMSGPWGLLAQGIQDTASMGIGAALGGKQTEEERKRNRAGQAADMLQKIQGWRIGQSPGELKYDPNEWANMLQGAMAGMNFSQGNQQGTQIMGDLMAKGREQQQPTLMGQPMGEGIQTDQFSDQSPWARV